ncbi:MAG: hypothetical protein WAP35_08900 [Solirubrobacterales bacterium]
MYSVTYSLKRAIAIVAFIFLLTFTALSLTSSASANVLPTITTTLDDNRLGVHSSLTVEMKFNYGASHIAAYPPTSPWNESIKHIVVDIPTGMVGNPNAVPYADRCDPATFANGVCPDSATVGELNVDATLLPTAEQVAADPPELTDSYLNLFFTSLTGNRLSLLQTGPDVPAIFGLYIPLPGFLPDVRQTIQIAPDTLTDLKLRATTLQGISQTLVTGTPPSQTTNYVRIKRVALTFFGTLANGNAFMTNPTRCELWGSTLYAQAYENNSNASAFPIGSAAGAFVTQQAAPITPDCTNGTAVPFPISGTTTVSSPKRDVSPDFDFTITNAGVQGPGQASTTPKKVVTTVPASINVDVLQLGRICTNEQFAADACPASTRIGTVAIETPLIRAGLSGDVYLVTTTNGILPDLGMHIRGEVRFTQRGVNKYVGVRGNQIQTTFDNIPQVGFSKLNVHLFGGPDGLLRTLGCPSSNKQPQDGSFSYAFTGYGGQTASSTTKLNAANCFGVQKLRRFSCVYRLLRFQPVYTSRARLKRVYLYIDKKRVATAKRVPFQFRHPMRKIRKGKHKIQLKAVYDDGTVSKKNSSFKRC